MWLVGILRQAQYTNHGVLFFWEHLPRWRVHSIQNGWEELRRYIVVIPGSKITLLYFFAEKIVLIKKNLYFDSELCQRV